MTHKCVNHREALVQGKRCLVNADRFAIRDLFDKISVQDVLDHQLSTAPQGERSDRPKVRGGCVSHLKTSTAQQRPIWQAQSGERVARAMSKFALRDSESDLTGQSYERVARAISIFATRHNGRDPMRTVRLNLIIP